MGITKKEKVIETKTCETCHEDKPLSDFYTYTKIHCDPCASIQRKISKEKKKRIELEQTQLIPIKLVKKETLDNISLEDIVRIQGDLIRDLQKRVTVLEEILLEKSVSKLSI